MHRFRIYVICFALVLFVTACNGAASQPTAVPSSAIEAEPTATPPRAPRNVYIPTEFNLLYYPTDINIIGITERPQFINAYADWCRECLQNRPTIHALQAEFGDRIDFLHVDIENDGAMDAVSPLGITGQTQYLLLDSAGDVVLRWFGYLEEAEVAAALAQILNES